MLIGRDVSHWNGNTDVNAGEFTILKVSEGQTWRDPKAEEYVRQTNKEQLLGAYHYLRPDIKGNHPYKEAENFVNTLLKLGILYRAVLSCDYEAKSLGHEEYLLQFLQGVEIMTGVKPLVYCSSSATKKLKNVCNQGFGLWVAHYNVNNPTIYNWKKCDIWQFNSKPFDVNIFNGDASDWLRLSSKQ